MNYKEKYEMALEGIQEILSSGEDSIKMSRLQLRLQGIFPELKESEDERMVKFIKNQLFNIKKTITENYELDVKLTKAIDWLEKQGNNINCIYDKELSELLHIVICRYINDPDISYPERENVSKKILPYVELLEKQGEQEQLYIRFGEIPTDEKSKIFQGEIEVGTENGVSVYPAFKTSEGDVVLGLSLPITKTTLYTQQHLIEYDDRPCYLVKGDYVGKDTDGQPLINNVSIIEKIDTYRVKEKKQDKESNDRNEPKFKVANQ